MLQLRLEGNVYQIIEFQHVKPGKGAAFVRTKLKNIKSGGVVEKTFRPTEKFPQARIDRKDMQYLYSATETCITSWIRRTIEQIALNEDDSRRCSEVRKRERDGVRYVPTMATYLPLSLLCS